MGTETIKIQGIDLKIDTAVQQICETSNATSGSTRSVLYILVIINVLTFMCLLNTHKYNWTNGRVESFRKKIVSYQLRMHKQKLSLENMILTQDSLDTAQQELNGSLRNLSDNYRNIKMPLLAIAFDINSLSILSGITISLLLLILKFTLEREVNNLRIAFNSISERYTDNADKSAFFDQLKERFYTRQDDALALINYTRRRHHYNFLSMNEIFNMPPLDESKYNHDSLKHKILMKIFLFPTITFAVVMINDMLTVEIGNNIQKTYSIVTIMLSFAFMYFIVKLSLGCTTQKRLMFNLYKDFRDKDYKHSKS